MLIALLTSLLLNITSMPSTVPAAQSVVPTPQFRRYGLAEGLPSSSIDGLAQDAQGYIWVATGSGLVRYDGTTFKVWRHNPDDPQSVSSGRLPSLLVDKVGRLWAGGADGLNRYDPTSNSFLHWRHNDHAADSLASDDLSALAEDDQGNLWVGNFSAGLDRLHADGKGFDHWRHDPNDPDSLASDRVLGLLNAPDGGLWIGTEQGLDLRMANGKFKHIRFVRPPDSDHDKSLDVRALSYAGSTLIISTPIGPYYLDSEQVAQRLAPGQIPDYFVLSVTPDNQGRLWIGTNNGLYLRDQANVIHHFSANASLPYALPNHNVVRLLLDKEGGVWIATDNGLAYLGPDWNEFARTVARPNDPSSIDTEPVSTVAAASNGRLWVGHDKGAIDRLDPVTQQVEHIAYGSPGSHHTILGMLEDPRGRLWATTAYGLLLLDHGKLKTVTPAFWAYRLVMDEQEHIYTDLDDGSGMVSVDPDTLQVTRLTSADPEVTHNLQRIQDVRWLDHALWIAGPYGLTRWTPAQTTVQFVPGVERSFIHSIDISGERLWVLGEKNLDVYHWNGERAERLASYPLSQRRPLDDTLGLRMDHLGRAWMFTRSGLWYYDPANDGLHSFDVQNGLVDLHFTSDVPAKLADGRLYAPTMDSIVSFLPESIHGHARKPVVVLNSITVQRNGRKQTLQPDHGSLELRWNDRDFSVDVRALTYIAPGHNVYRFLIDDTDNWIDNGGRTEHTFAQLSGGDYRLRVQAAGPDGIWSELATPLQLHVESPPWLRWWAWLIYALLLAALILTIVWLTRRRQRRQHGMELLAQEHRFAREANAAKTRFLAELGHEIRTPMTGVLGMAELLLNQPLPPQQRSYAQTIKNSGEVLLTLVNDALDLARIEAGRLELILAPFDPRALLEDILALGLERASVKGLALSMDVTADVPARVIGDAVRIKQIILNLTHNALKFTEHGSVRLTLETRQDCLLFSVRDTGSGISSDDQLRLFHHFQQLDGPQRGSGSGLGLAICRKLADLMGGEITLHSETGQGSVFHLSLPLHASTHDLHDLPARTSTPAGSCWQLLLLEDDSVVAAVVIGLLQAQGHVVTHVTNGLQGLQMLEQHPFDAAFVDLDLPGLDGLQWAQLVRARETHGSHLPMIAITARADSDQEALTRRAGMDGFLRKPLSGEQLGDALAKQLDRTRSIA